MRSDFFENIKLFLRLEESAALAELDSVNSVKADFLSPAYARVCMHTCCATAVLR